MVEWVPMKSADVISANLATLEANLATLEVALDKTSPPPSPQGNAVPAPQKAVQAVSTPPPCPTPKPLPLPPLAKFGASRRIPPFSWNPTPPSHKLRTLVLGVVIATGAMGVLWGARTFIVGPHTKTAATTTTPASDDLVKIIDVQNFYLKGVQADGKTIERHDGSASWRYNNPARLIHGDFTRKMGALGEGASKLAIFPSYAMGRKAAEVLLFEAPEMGYSTVTVQEAINKWALQVDKYDTRNYADHVAKAAGVSVDVKMSVLLPDQRTKFIGEVEREERLVVGTQAVVP